MANLILNFVNQMGRLITIEDAKKLNLFQDVIMIKTKKHML